MEYENSMTVFRIGSTNCKVIRHISLFMIVVFTLFGCSSDPLRVNITEFSACKGWDESGKPVGISKNFSPHEQEIYACGRLRTNRPPLTISVEWYYENKQVSREILRGVDDYFYSRFNPTEGHLLEGDYRIEVVVGRLTMQEAEFQVKSLD